VPRTATTTLTANAASSSSRCWTLIWLSRRTSPPIRTAITSAAAITAKKRNTLAGCLQLGRSRLFAQTRCPEIPKGKPDKGSTDKQGSGRNENERRPQSVVERTRDCHPAQQASLGY